MKNKNFSYNTVKFKLSVIFKCINIINDCKRVSVYFTSVFIDGHNIVCMFMFIINEAMYILGYKAYINF